MVNFEDTFIWNKNKELYITNPNYTFISLESLKKQLPDDLIQKIINKWLDNEYFPTEQYKEEDLIPMTLALEQFSYFLHNTADSRFHNAKLLSAITPTICRLFLEEHIGWEYNTDIIYQCLVNSNLPQLYDLFYFNFNGNKYNIDAEAEFTLILTNTLKEILHNPLLGKYFEKTLTTKVQQLLIRLVKQSNKIR